MAKDNPFNLFNNDSSNSSSFASREQNTNDIAKTMQDIRQTISDLRDILQRLSKDNQLLADLDNKIIKAQQDGQNAQKQLATALHNWNISNKKAINYATKHPTPTSSQLKYLSKLSNTAIADENLVKQWRDVVNKQNQLQSWYKSARNTVDLKIQQRDQERQNLSSQISSGRKNIHNLRNQRQQSLIDDINAQFKDSKLSKAFYDKFVRSDKLGLTTKGQVVGAGMSTALQTQDRFIRKLVLSLGQLPIFQKVGKSLIQLGGIFALHGASKLFGKDQNLGSRFSGLVEILGGGLLALMPVLGTAFGHIAGEMIAQLLGRKLLAKAFTNLLKGNVAGSVSSLSGFGKIGALLSKFVPFFTKVLGPLAGLVSVFQSIKNLFSGKSKGTDWFNLFSGIALILAPFFGPAAPIVAGIAGILQGITAIIDNWKGIKNWFKDHWPFGKDKIQNDGGSGKNYTISPSYNKVGVAHVDGAMKWQDAGRMSTWSKDGWDYYRFGGNPANMGQGKWIGIDTSKYSKEQLNAFAKRGMYNLEALQGGNGIQIADTFYNDAIAGRKGSNILLQTAAARMRQMGHGDLIITSALASATSDHSKSIFGHGGGQTFDFNAKDLSPEQAIQYARDLKSTGLFSHAQAEYNSDVGEWHIDARLSDQAYNELNKQAQKANEDNRPINQMVAEQKKQQPAQTEFDNIINNNLAISRGMFEKANYR